jgi:glycosyltransferase involved in cell wall biosynthesis
MLTKVLFLQTQMKQYRLPFFAKLHAALLQNGIEMKVAYSDPPGLERLKQDNVDLPREIGVKVPGYQILGGRFLYQALLRPALAADLVIAEQSNRNVHNYALLLSRMLRPGRLAFWGLGKNKDVDHSKVSEWLRPTIARGADWWFTYTKGTANWLVANGVAHEKITVMQNSTDTLALARQITKIPCDQVEETRRRLGIEPGSRVGIYCGILTGDKGITLLLEASQLIQKRISHFHILVLGGGPESIKVKEAAQQSPWIHYLGPKFGEEKALFLKMSDCFLLPGRVGLAILDAFAAGIPLFTTKMLFHGPEVEYLEEGLNGRMTAENAEAYAESVTEVLSEPALLEDFKVGARESAKRYSIEVMVERCQRGIIHCLNTQVSVTGVVDDATNPPPASSGGEKRATAK